MTASTEIRPLTGLRGIAALYVMIFHYFGGTPLSNPATTFLSHGYLAVDLFFVLSGFVMALNYAEMFVSCRPVAAYRKFLGRRIARVYPLYFAGTVAGFFLVTDSMFPVPKHTLGNLALNLSMAQGWGFTNSFDLPAWSVSTEWAAYLLFPLLIVPTLFRKPLSALLSAVVSVGCLAVICLPPVVHSYHLPQGDLLNYYEGVVALFRCLPEFVLGLLAYRLAATRFGSYLAASPRPALSICTATLLLLTIPRADLIIVLCFPLLVVTLASGQHLAARLLASSLAEWAGKLSYSIYMTHFLSADLLNFVHAKAHSFGIVHAQTCAAAVGIAITVPAAWLSYTYIEVPGRRWLRNVLEGESPKRVRNERTAIIAQPEG